MLLWLYCCGLAAVLLHQRTGPCAAETQIMAENEFPGKFTARRTTGAGVTSHRPREALQRLLAEIAVEHHRNVAHEHPACR